MLPNTHRCHLPSLIELCEMGAELAEISAAVDRQAAVSESMEPAALWDRVEYSHREHPHPMPGPPTSDVAPDHLWAVTPQ